MGWPPWEARAPGLGCWLTNWQGCGGGGEDAPPQGALSPIVPGLPPEVRNVMRISQRSSEVSDASSFGRKLWPVRRTPPGCLPLGLRGPDSRVTAPASISEGSDVVSGASSSAHPPKVSGWSSALLSSFHTTPPPPPGGNLSHTPGFNPYLCDDTS